MDDGIRLTVQNPLSFRRVGEPVSTGVPLPDKLLSSTDGLQLVDADGAKVQAQFVPLAWWGKGAWIKWVLVRFLATVEENSSAVYRLVLSTDKTEPRPSVVGRRDDGELWADTGALQLRLDGEEGVLGAAVMLTLPDGRRLQACYETLEVEENGPVAAVVRLQGAFRPEGQYAEEGCPASDMRVELWHGRREIRLTHRLTASAGRLELRDLSLCLPAPAGAACTIGDEGGEAVWLGECGMDRPVGILQVSESETVIGDLNDKATGSQPEQRHRDRKGWWLATAGEHGAMVVTMRDFTERFPKSLQSSHGQLKAGLLPGASTSRDSFLPGNQVRPYYELCPGEARTHQVMLHLASPEAVKSSVCGSLAAAFQQPMHALAGWDWYTESGALGELLPRSVLYPEYEAAVDRSLEIFLDRRTSMGLYGDRNYGDDQYTRLGVWNNGEYDYAHVGMLHFLRGAGDAWFGEVAMPYARHMMDIDVCHTGPYAGFVHQHTEWHNSETPKLGSHAWIRGLLEYYCFTGDYYARDSARLIADTWSGKILEGDGFESTERGMTWPVISMLAAYDTFPEERYLQAASTLIEQVLLMQDPVEGNFTGSMDRPTTKDRWGTFVIGSPVMESLVMYYATTGDERAREAVVRIGRRLGRLNWLEEIGAWEYTHSKLQGPERIHNDKTDKMVTPGVLYAYLYGRDEELLDKARRAFAYSESKPANNGKDLGQTYCFGIRIPALLEKCRQLRKNAEEN